VAAVYAAAGDRVIENATLYQAVARQTDVASASMGDRVPIGSAGVLHPPLKRAGRWHQHKR